MRDELAPWPENSGESASMPQTMLKALVKEKHLSGYRRFKRAYQEAARAVDKDLADSYPSDATHKRWLTGQVKNLPRAEHCAVLEAMFPGWIAADLFAPYVPPEKVDNSTLFRELLRRRHLQTYRAFCQAYDKVLSANICASLSHLAIQLGQSEDAARISESGLPSAAQGEGTAHLVARLHAMRARAAAIQGDEKVCLVSLDAARDALHNHAGSPSAGWIAGFDEASLASESALCLYSLGFLDEAEREARRVVELRVGDRVRSRAFGQLTLANVLLRKEIFDEAATIGLEICSVARSLNSTRVLSGLSRLGESLSDNWALPEAASFLESLTQLKKSAVESRVQTRWPV